MGAHQWEPDTPHRPTVVPVPSPGPRPQREEAPLLARGVHLASRGLGVRADLRLDLVPDLDVLAQELARVLAALPEPHLAVRDEGARLAQDAHLDADVEQAAFLRDALVVEDIELGCAERRRDLVLDDLDLRPDADRVLALLDRLDPADIHADGGVELQRAAARRRLRVAEHHADLLAELVREHHARLRAVDRAGQLAQRLAQQPRLEARVAVTHLALDLGARHERGDRVDDDHVDRAGPDQRLGDLERLFAGVRLADVEVLDVDAALGSVLGVERVLGVDERGDAAGALSLGDDVLHQRRLTGRLRTVDLD